MKLQYVQLIIGFIWLGLAVVCAINRDTPRFHTFIIIANMWILGSQIVSKINDK